MATIIPRSGRLIGKIIPDVTISENTSDDIELTQHPVQYGAAISDHKYKKPITLKMELLFSGDNQADLALKYQSLLDLQIGADLFDVTTPKRIYKNMQIKSISVTTDKNSENILGITCELQEVIVVSVVVTNTPPRANQKNAKKTGQTSKSGTKSTTTNDDKKKPQVKSALSQILGG